MLRAARTAILLLTLGGCATPRHAVVYGPGPDRPVANLALGPSRDHTLLAEMYTYRSSWPSAWSGHVFDDVSTYMQVIYDDQSFYDTALHGGGYTHQTMSVRTGVVVR